MNDLPLHRCRGCGAHIIWATTPAGERMPLDPEPVGDGNVELLPHARCVVHTPGQTALFDSGERYVSHFATCPNADEFRRTG